MTPDMVAELMRQLMKESMILAAPVLPKSSTASSAQLNVPGEPQLSNAKWGGLPDQHQLGQPVPVFPRIETAV